MKKINNIVSSSKVASSKVASSKGQGASSAGLRLPCYRATTTLATGFLATGYWLLATKRFLLSLAAALSLLAGPAHALDISDYTAYPPFLPRVTSPNILFLLDYSKSMVRPAYGACSSISNAPATISDSACKNSTDANCLSNCRTNFSNLSYDYNSSTTYPGYFDSKVSGQKYDYDVTSPNAFTKSSSVTDAKWSANFLNWLTTTQFDTLKKAVVAGDFTPAPENAAGNITVNSILTAGYNFRKQMNLPSSGNSTSCSSTDSPNCTQWPMVTDNWISTPASGTTTIFTATNDSVSPVQTLPFAFTAYGNTYTQIYISSNGWLSFTNPSGDSGVSNENMPSTNTPNNIIAPYWDDLYVDNAKSSSVKTFTTGTAPNRIFVVTYQDVYHYGERGVGWGCDANTDNLLTFQALLYEGSNHIVFQYKDVKPAATCGGGKQATIGVENSGGTGAKKYSYNGSTLLTANGTTMQAIFATPHVSYTITPSGTATVFAPAAPLGNEAGNPAPCKGNAGPCSASNTGPYNITINAIRQMLGGGASCPSGFYKNKEGSTSGSTRCYDHETEGLMQDLRDGELGGTLGFRLGIMKLNSDATNAEGGVVTKHFNDKDDANWSTLMNATRGQRPTDNTPLAEALHVAQGYFRQNTSYNLGLTASNSWTNTGTGSACDSNSKDPYCFRSAGQKVSCCKSFVLMVSSGNYSTDNTTNIYGDDANAETHTWVADAWRSTDDAGSEGTFGNEGWLDNVAYKSHTPDPDLRPELEATQNLTIYAVDTYAEESGDGTNVLKKAAKYGGFEDADVDNAYDADKFNLVSGQCTSVASGGTYGEDDKNCDGKPDTYFAATGGSDLKSKIISAVMDIMKSSASGTSVSVLSTSAGGEGAIYQAYFYPAKLEGTTDERAWPGFIKSFFLDKKQNLRDDSSGGTYTCSGDSCTYSGTPNAALSATGDKIAQMCLNTTTNEVKVRLFSDAADGNYVTDTANDGTCPSVTSVGDPITVGMDDVVSIWEAGKKLAIRAKSTRNIYTWAPTSVTGAVNTGGFSSLSGTPMDFTDANKTALSPYLRAAAGDVDGAGTTYNAFTADKEAEYIIRFIRGEAITPVTVSADGTGVNYRNRCVTIDTDSESDEAGCTSTSGESQRVWALGDIINSTPTLVSGPGEQYDLLYKDSDYVKFRAKYQNRRRMVYVGANDGMLHAFNAGLFNESTTSFGDNPVSPAVNGWGSAALGDELWAFVPYDNLPHLQWLACNGTSTDPSQCGSSEYTHVYYVDARPKVTDVRIFCRNATADSAYVSTFYPSTCINGQGDASHPNGWGTIMIMSMRLGGGAIDVTIDGTNREFRSAYYAFDVTDPEKPPKLLWRFYDSTLGFTTSYPAIARICTSNNTPCSGTEKWYMVVGSGSTNTAPPTGKRNYGGNDTAGPGKVFVVELVDYDSDGTLLEKSFTFAVNEYMGDPLVVDENFDFTSDVIYIGSSSQVPVSQTSPAPPSPPEIGGKVYRIKTNGTIAGSDSSVTECLSDTSTTADWCRSVLIDAGKPVLTAPSVATDSQSPRNLWVFFGTGRLRNSGDPSDLTNSEPQTFYGIKDACGKKAILTTTPKTGVCSNSYTASQLASTSASDVTLLSQDVSGVVKPVDCTACTTPTNYNSLLSMMRRSDVKGWYYNLNDPATASERVLSRPAVLGGLVLFTTYTPAASICSIFGDSRLYALNYETGTAYNKAIIGTSDTGVSTTTSSTGTKVSKALELGKGMPTAVGIAVGEKVTGFVQKSTGEIIRIEAEPGTSIKSGAASWREKTGGGGTSEIETIYKHIVK